MCVCVYLDYCPLIGIASPPPPPPLLLFNLSSSALARACTSSLHISPTSTLTLLSPSPSLPVPDPNIPLPTPPPDPNDPKFIPDFHVILKTSPRQTRSEVEDLVDNSGYKVLWVAPYRVGPDLKPYFDVILTNSTQADTKGFLDLNIDDMNLTIFDQRALGYFAQFIVSRDRGKNPSAPSYSAVFTPKNSLFETEVYLRDSVEQYESRLSTKTAAGYRLLSHTFCRIQGQWEVASVYERDRRLAFNISVPDTERISWQSEHNLTFFRFSEVALRLSREGFYPSYIQTYKDATTGNSKFAAVFEKPGSGANLNWFRWALNITTVQDTITAEVNDGIWEPLVTLAYDYLGNIRHYVGFTRRRFDY